MAHINPLAPIMVTGGTGFIASWIIKELLEKGKIVHATVRDKSKTAKYAHLLEIAKNATGSLEIFEADLLDPGSFEAGMVGCQLVLHTASPFVIQGIKDPQKELIDPALKGTRNVLEAVNKNSTVQRVVLTSSVVAMYGDSIDIESMPGKVMTKDVWNTTSSLDHQPYAYSKTLAEKEAWKMVAEQERWDLVVINPSFVLGPALNHGTGSASLSLMKQLVGGEFKMGVPDLSFGIVDVRDVAHAHVEAGMRAEAHGRYISTSTTEAVSFLEMAAAIRKEFGNKFALPKRQLPKWLIWLVGPIAGFSRKYVSKNVGYRLRFNNAKGIEELGLDYRPWQESVVGHVQEMLDSGQV